MLGDDEWSGHPHRGNYGLIYGRLDVGEWCVCLESIYSTAIDTVVDSVILDEIRRRIGMEWIILMGQHSGVNIKWYKRQPYCLEDRTIVGGSGLGLKNNLRVPI